ncbi:hypothetical protein H0E87_029363 [Populus deltoides]|uniref:Peptidase A1 domain-containing protein n=1 Tax=Populus deltoides TaxID=3696 RepID=A0A8T2WPB3_POPDE|nr:hypothetical protein H0E87_029363 [Populus deltoides]
MAAIDIAILFVAFTSHFTLTMSTTMVALAPAIPKPKRLVTKLIHRDSIFSPRYNANGTIADRARRAMETSIARFVQVSGLVSDSHDIRTTLLLSQPSELFYINFSIGHPPLPQLAIMDSGSSFLWIKCLPCSPCSSKSPISIFDPRKSLTYSSMSWIDRIYVFEQLTFETIDDTKIVVPRVLLGCGRNLEVDKAATKQTIGRVREDLSGFPAVTFHFANGAQLVLDTQSMFLHIAPRVFCLAMGSVNGDNSKNLSVIGIMAQQNYNVGYDIGQNKLYFQRIDCELLAD